MSSTETLTGSWALELRFRRIIATTRGGRRRMASRLATTAVAIEDHQ